VEFIAVSVGMQEFSNEHFRLGVFAFDGRHIFAAISLEWTSAMGQS